MYENSGLVVISKEEDNPCFSSRYAFVHSTRSIRKRKRKAFSCRQWGNRRRSFSNSSCVTSWGWLWSKIVIDSASVAWLACSSNLPWWVKPDDSMRHERGLHIAWQLHTYARTSTGDNCIFHYINHNYAIFLYYTLFYSPALSFTWLFSLRSVLLFLDRNR